MYWIDWGIILMSRMVESGLIEYLLVTEYTFFKLLKFKILTQRTFTPTKRPQNGKNVIV